MKNISELHKNNQMNSFDSKLQINHK